MYYKCQKVKFKHGGSYSPDWIKKKKSNNKSKNMKLINVYAHMKKFSEIKKEFQTLNRL